MAHDKEQDDDSVSHVGGCECGALYTADLPPKERAQYREELAAWKAAKPTTTAEWISISLIAEGEEEP